MVVIPGRLFRGVWEMCFGVKLGDRRVLGRDLLASEIQ
jgi:hypothetical protein